MNNKIILFVIVILLIPLGYAETLSSEKVVCWEFNCTSNWTIGSGFRIIDASSIAVFSSIYYPNTSSLSQNIGANNHEKYLISLDVKTTWFDWHNFWVELGNVSSSKFNSTGIKTFYIETNGSGNLILWVNRTYNKSINANVIFNNISVKKDLEYNVSYNLSIVFGNGTEESGAVVDRDWVYVNVSTVIDVYNEDTIIFNLYNETDLINSSSYTNSQRAINWTFLPYGIYYYNVSINNTLGFTDSTETRNMTLAHASSLNISFGEGTLDNEAVANQNFIYVNVSVIASGEDTITFNLYNETDLINSSGFTDKRRTINWTSLPEGTYYYNVFINDTYGASNSTEQRVITIYWETNVSSCKTLYDNGVYTQIQDIEANTTPSTMMDSDCIEFYGNNITFNGNGYKINQGGIFIFGSNNSASNFNVNHLQVYDGTNNLIEDGIIQNCSYECVYMGPSNPTQNTLRNIYINNSNGVGIKFWGIAFGGEGLQGASHNIFQDIKIENINLSDIVTTSFLGFGTNINNSFINCSYNISKESVGAQSSLIRKWHYQSYINDTFGNAISGVNVVVYNSSSDYQFNLTTGMDGLTGTAEIIEYVNNAGTKKYQSNYSIYTSKSCYPNLLNSWNATSQHNNIDVLTLGSSTYQNWNESMANNCVINYPISMSNYNLTYYGNGWFKCNTTISLNRRQRPSANQIFYFGSGCLII